MKRKSEIARLHSFVIILALFLSACSTDTNSPGSIIDECDGENLYGPAGGEIEITEENSFLYGLRVVIPAGALEECRSFWVDDCWLPSLPLGCIAYPTGHTQFNLETGGDKPYGLELEFFFPVEYLEVKEGESPCAFGYDRRVSEWKVILPDVYDGNTLWVRTTYLDSWNWGKIDLDKVSPENLSDAMKEQYGETEWNSAIAGINQAAELLKTLYVDSSCDTWITMRDDYLPELIQQQRNILESYQSQIDICGDCNLLSPEFGLTLSEYILAKIVVLATDLWSLFTGGWFGFMPFLGEANMLINCERLMAMAIIEDSVCDFPCVTEKVGYSVYTTYALHYVYMVTHYMVTLAIEGDFWVTCP